MDEQGTVSQPQSSAEGAGKPSKDACMWAMLCHLLAIFTGFIAPLIIWLIKKGEDPFVDHHGKEALNFQITVAIALIVSWLLCFICVGFVLLPAVWIADLVFLIIASIKASNGEMYKYPLSIRLIK
jgi:uncharacterized Tic20 family protein